MIHFTNPGLIPVEAITTLGVNVKEGDSPIGYFGTGLKYAIAVTLRLGGAITIYRGLDAYSFAISPRLIRGKTFHLITMNGQDLGFTTDLGKNWEPWQALREVYSNMLDEGGGHGRGPGEPREGYTLIAVSGLDKEYSHLDQIVLRSEPLASNASVAIHPGPGQFIFYKGIRCALAAPKPSPVTYNITATQRLTEDRTFTDVYSIAHLVSDFVRQLTDEPLIYKILAAGEDHFEWALPFPYFLPSSPEFKSALRDACRRQPNLVSPAAKQYLSGNLSIDERYETADLTSWEADIVAQAIAFIKRTGIFTCSARVKVARSLPGAHGMADRESNTVILSQDLLSKGLVYVIGTLFEEYAHLEKNLNEREVADFFLDRLINLMMEKYGVPTASNPPSPTGPNDRDLTFTGGSEEIPF